MAENARRGVALLAAAVALASAPIASAATPVQALPNGDPATAATMPEAPPVAAYRLGAGDKVRLTVYNEETMSGDYEVDGSGTMSLPLIGAVRVLGLSLPDVTALITAKLRQGYLQNPSVAVEVLNYRPFYVLGEVKEPGKYPYASGMTVLNAIALAGGYTYRGKKSFAMVMRAGDPARREQRVAPTDIIMPGDIIRVPERIF